MFTRHGIWGPNVFFPSELQIDKKNILLRRGLSRCRPGIELKAWGSWSKQGTIKILGFPIYFGSGVRQQIFGTPTLFPPDWELDVKNHGKSSFCVFTWPSREKERLWYGRLDVRTAVHGTALRNRTRPDTTRWPWRICATNSVDTDCKNGHQRPDTQRTRS